MTAKALGVRNAGNDGIVSLEDADGANRTIGVVDEALKRVNKQRADLGAYQNRLEHAIKGIDVGAENLQAAESRIRDTDMAKRDGRIHQEPHPGPGRRRHARPGQPEDANGLAVAPVA